MFGSYEDNNNEEVQLSLDTIENIIEEIHNVESAPKIPSYTKIS